MSKVKNLKSQYNDFRKRHHKTFFKIIVGFFIVIFLFGLFQEKVEANPISTASWIATKIAEVTANWSGVSKDLDSLKNGSGGGNLVTNAIADAVTDYALKSQKSSIANLIVSINDGIGNSAEKLFSVKNPLAVPGNLEKFRTMKSISNTFFTLGIVFILITIVFDIKIGESEVLLTKLLKDMFISVILLNVIEPTLPVFIKVAGAFTKYFASDLVTVGGVKTMFTLGIGVALNGNNGSIMMLSLGILVLLLISLCVLIGLFFSSIGVSNLCAIIVIISPVLFALYVTPYGKEVAKKIFYLIAFLLCVGPLQALALSVGAASISTDFTFLNLLSCCACLIFTVGAVPTFTFFIFNMAQQPKV